MKNKSIWELSTKLNKNNSQPIQNNISTDILIIGAGITGLTTAYFLKDINKKITIIDKSLVGMGVTSKTTAKITYLQQDIYRKLTLYHGKSKSQEYYDSQKEAINIITKIIKDNKIQCDLEKSNSIIFTNEEKNINKIKKEKDILLSWNINVQKYQNNNIKYGITVSDTYTFNPLKYINFLRQIIEPNIQIYENTLAISIIKKGDQYLVKTNNGLIKSKIIIIACHYQFFIIPNMLPLKTYIERDYVNATKVNNSKKINAINIDNKLYSVRYYKDYLIYVTNSHRLTNKINYAKNYQKSRQNFQTIFNKEPSLTWMNQDIMSNDLLPFIGKIKPNLYISTGYNTWGMTNGTIGGKIIADLITNKQNEYINLFNPNRVNIPLIINSFVGVFHYLKAYIESIFHKNNPRYIKIKGIIYGIYTDKEGIEHRVKLICPHMKCLLVFNKEENTWDCPCHGSRFDLDGNIIESPAIKKI